MGLLQWLNAKPGRWLVVVGVCALAVFGYLQPPGIFTDPDSFYHLRLTTMLRDGGLVRDFPWTQAALYKNIFIDHHFGYHLLLLPFVSVLPEFAGMQVATVVFATFSVLVVAWCLKRWKVPYWGVGVLVLLTSSPLLFRLSLAKAPSIGVGVAFVAYYLIIERRLGWLFWWTWFFTWLYSAWPLTIVMAGVYLTIDALNVNKVSFSAAWQRLWRVENVKLMGVVAAGCVAGLVINPYFPTNLLYLKQLFTMALVAYHKFIGIGAEWYPYDPFELPAHVSYPLLVWLLATVAGLFSLKRQSTMARTSWAMTLIFLAYTFRARRQVEYLVPWLVLSSSLTLRDWVGSDLRAAWASLKAKADSWQPDWLKRRVVRGAIGLYLLIFIPVGLWHGVESTQEALRDGFTFGTLRGASTWLKQNTPAHSIVFQTDWGTFPMLFYYNTHNYYLTGLDQTFMYEHNHDLYWAWVNTTSGDRSDAYHVVHDLFGASYVLVEKRVGIMLRVLQHDPRFHKVYEDKEALVFAL